MAYWLSDSHVTDDVTWPQRCCEAAVRSSILATTWLLVFILIVLELFCLVVMFDLAIIKMLWPWAASLMR